MPSDLRSKAWIAENGTIFLGKNFCADAHGQRSLRIVTHAHADHVLGLRESAKECEQVAMTQATSELVEAIYGIRVNREKLRLMEYGKTLSFEGEKLTLFDGGHILGSAQVSVETERGERIVYTGDFKLPEAPILRSDLLVIEATYGNPVCTRPFEDRVESELLKLVEANLRRAPVYIFGYHGKLQEVCQILRRGGIAEPILMPSHVYSAARVYEEHGFELGEFFLAESLEGKKASKRRHLGLYHMGSARRISGVTKVYLSGWEFEAPVRKVGEGEYEVALSDHSDFEGLIEYVSKSGPEFVITDDYRVGDAKALARELEERLGVRARPMPISRKAKT